MKFAVLALVLAAATTSVLAEDAADGEKLHADNCVACHTNMTGGDGSALYTRNDRRVSSLSGLEAQVRLCESNLGLRWFDDEVLSVVTHLNKTYYHFEENASAK